MSKADAAPVMGGRYAFAGHSLVSVVPLPSLPIIRADIASTYQLHVVASSNVGRLPERTGWRHEWLDRHGNPCLQLSDGPGTTGNRLLRVPGVLDAWIHPQQGRLRIEHAGADAATIEHILIDQILPRVLAEAGALVIHASCVGIEGSSFVFMGESGWGKSTLAGLLHQQGHRLLSDDCTVLDFAGDCGIRATPTYPSIRLLDDSRRQLFDSRVGTASVAEYSNKRRVQLATEGTHDPVPAPVRAIYLLNDPAEPVAEPRVSRLAPVAACAALITHGFRLDPRSRERTRSVMAQAAEVANRVPAFTIAYPRDFATRGSLIATLLAHTASLHPGN